MSLCRYGHLKALAAVQVNRFGRLRHEQRGEKGRPLPSTELALVAVPAAELMCEGMCSLFQSLGNKMVPRILGLNM